MLTLHRLINSQARNWKNCYNDKIMICSYHYFVHMVNYQQSDNMNLESLTVSKLKLLDKVLQLIKDLI
jgi:poly(A) polymerase Pap1